MKTVDKVMRQFRKTVADLAKTAEQHDLLEG